jgi:ubiquinone/menaquinone biosynthesis C-methylase UbiE
MKKKWLVLLAGLIGLHLVLFNQWIDRDSWQEPEKVMDALGIKPGMVIGEAGVGSGYFTFKLSKRVGPGGKIYANEIAGRHLKTIERRCRREGIHNIETILGTETDPLFPDGELDMVIMVYVFHHLSRPKAFLKSIKPDLKPGAPVVILEQEPQKTGSTHFLPRGTILKHIDNAGYRVKEILEFLKKDTIYVIEPNNSGSTPLLHSDQQAGNRGSHHGGQKTGN